MCKILQKVGLVVMVMALVGPQLGWAQSSVATGQVYGTIADPDGAGMPGVSVEAKNADTGLARHTITDDSGGYRIDLLPSGNYDLRAALSGFKTEVKKGVQVTLGSTVRIDFDLQISAVEEEIVVTAEAPVIETTSASVSAAVSDTAIANLPLYGRDFTDLVALTPATVSGTSDEIEGGRGGINMGARAIQNSFNIDGSNSQSSFFGEERGGTRPPFTFSQAAIKEFQVIRSSYNLQFNSTGGVINAITKSGTNELHGEVFGYYSDESFVGEDAAGDEATDFEKTQYGFALGGPFIRDKLHYFVSYDGQDFQTPYFAEFEDLPQDRIAEWEQITGLDYATEVGEIPQTNDASVILLKLDWQASDNHLVTFRDNWSDQEGQNLTSNYSDTGLSSNGLEENSFNSFVASLTSVLSEDMFNEVIFQYALEERPRTPNNMSLPETGIYPYLATWGRNQYLPNGLDEERLQVIDNLTYFLGAHNLKAGVSVDLVSYDDDFYRYEGGSYSYSSWDEFFNDEPYSFTQAFSDYDGRVKYDNNYYAFYLQDEWRANPNLTVTYGLRYDYQEHDKPFETNPLWTATGDIPNDSNNWAPRIGFAWDIMGDGKQVLRGGVGYFYDNTPTLLDANAMLANGVRVQRFTAYGDDAPSYPNVWTSPDQVQGNLYSDIMVFDPDYENPETWRMSLGYEREIFADFSVGVDLIYYETEKLERKLDRNIALDGGSTVDGRPTYDRYVNVSGLGKIIQFTSDAEAEYTAVVLKARKRYSNGWMLDASYTWSEAEDNDSNERDVGSSSAFPEDQLNLNGDWGPSSFNAEHKFVASVSYQLPYDFLISGIVFVRSGFPYSAGDGRDLNGDGYRNERATIEIGDGTYLHYKRNTFNQPYFRKVDLRLSKIFRFGANYELELIGEVFNLFDSENWITFEKQLVTSSGGINEDFGKTGPGNGNPGDPRAYQLGLKFRF